MRGAPQVGFSATIRKIRARTSLLTRLRPTCLALETQVQYKRNPARCQLATVLGVTKTRGFVHPDHNVFSATQNSLCGAVNRRRGRLACRASNCCRRARFSRMRSSRERQALTIQPRTCRSDTIMARILSGQSESSVSPSHSSCGCTTFWRGTAIDVINPRTKIFHLPVGRTAYAQSPIKATCQDLRQHWPIRDSLRLPAPNVFKQLESILS
jgi:hypothetical protein